MKRRKELLKGLYVYNLYKHAAMLVVMSFITFSLKAQSLPFPTIIKKDNLNSSIHPKLKGVWQSVGSGYILNASTEQIELYNYTDLVCYKEADPYRTDLLNTSALFSLTKKGDTLTVFLHNFGLQSSQLQAGQKFIKLDHLPAQCKELSDKQKNDPLFLFDVFYYTLKENYAFTQERVLNWQQIYESHKMKISSQTSKDSLHAIMGEVVKQTKDHHTKIIYKGKTLQHTGIASAELLYKVYQKQDTIQDFNAYINEFWKANYKGISEDLLAGKSNKAANGKLEWGHLTKEIGYLHVHSLTGFASSDLPRKQHIDTLTFYMDQIMKAFASKKAIIIDISFNFGGYDAAGLTIASYFTNKPVHVYDKYTYHKGEFYKSATFYIHPAPRYRFTKPVYVLTSGISRSAAETFAMQMKALPNAKTVGGNTLGILSDMLGKSIGEYYLTLSNEKYISPEGRMYEVKGVDADIPIEVFVIENMFNSHKEAVKKIITLIELDR